MTVDPYLTHAMLSIDVAAQLEKLGRAQLSKPESLVVELIRTAFISGATAATITIQRRGFTLQTKGPCLPINLAVAVPRICAAETPEVDRQHLIVALEQAGGAGWLALVGRPELTGCLEYLSASGNPVTTVRIDGHRAAPDGRTAAAVAPTATDVDPMQAHAGGDCRLVVSGIDLSRTRLQKILGAHLILGEPRVRIGRQIVPPSAIRPSVQRRRIGMTSLPGHPLEYQAAVAFHRVSPKDRTPARCVVVRGGLRWTESPLPQLHDLTLTLTAAHTSSLPPSRDIERERVADATPHLMECLAPTLRAWASELTGDALQGLQSDVILGSEKPGGTVLASLPVFPSVSLEGQRRQSLAALRTAVSNGAVDVRIIHRRREMPAPGESPVWLLSEQVYTMLKSQCGLTLNTLEAPDQARGLAALRQRMPRWWRGLQHRLASSLGRAIADADLTHAERDALRQWNLGLDASRADGRTIVFGNHPRGVLVNARHWLISRHDPALRHLVPSTTATPSLAYLAILAIGHADARPRADLARAWRAMVRDATRRTSNDA